MIALYVNTFVCVSAQVRSYKGKPTSIGHENVEMQCNGIKYGILIMPRRVDSVTAKGTISFMWKDSIRWFRMYTSTYVSGR